MKELDRVRELVEASERGALLDFFEIARAEVSNLPERSAGAGPLAELSMPVPDRPGVLAEVTTLAGTSYGAEFKAPKLLLDMAEKSETFYQRFDPYGESRRAA